MDAPALHGASAAFFLCPFQTTWSGNNRFNREAGQGLLKNYEVLVVRCGAANARTLQLHSCRIFPGSPIERIHRHDAPRQSMRENQAVGKSLVRISFSAQMTMTGFPVGMQQDEHGHSAHTLKSRDIQPGNGSPKQAAWGLRGPKVRDSLSPFQKKGPSLQQTSARRCAAFRPPRRAGNC